MKVTSPALEELKKALIQTQNPQAGIRLFAQEGCCGPGLQMALAPAPAEGENLVAYEEVNFFIDQKALEMLSGVTIDFGSQGFRLEGFRRSGGCGC
ncbi:MAG: iron-sulfur cluster biosynthesis family protein [Bacteroidales bacterium]